MTDNNLIHFPKAPIQSFVDANQFPDFSCSSFALVALGPVPKSILEEISKEVNEQASEGIGFQPSELEELGLVIGIPEKWDLNGKSIADAVQDHFERMQSCPSVSANPKNKDPKWYPVSFVSAMQNDWRQGGGLVVVYLEKDEDDGYLTLKSA